MINQESRGNHSYFSRWLAHHGESWPEQSRPIKIVEPEQADFFGARESDFLDGRERAQCHHVIGAENCCGTLPSRQKLHRVKMAAFHVVMPGVNHRAILADFRATYRAHESLQPVHGSSARSIAGDDSDVAVPQTQQIARGAF